MIQHPQYADWGIECQSCQSFVPLPSELDAAYVCCEHCGAEILLASFLVPNQ